MLDFGHGENEKSNLFRPITIDRPEVSIQMTEVARFLNFENLRQIFSRMLV